MANKLTWSLNVQIPGGPTIDEKPAPMVIDAYDQIDALIPHTPGEHVVNVQPGTRDQICFMLIRADKYPDPAAAEKKIVYEVVGAPAGGKPVTLHAPQVFVGAGSASIFPADPQSLKFTNTFDEEVAVHILVGRKAIG